MMIRYGCNRSQVMYGQVEELNDQETVGGGVEVLLQRCDNMNMTQCLHSL